MFSEWSPKARWSVHQGCGAKAPTLSLGGSSTSSLCPLPPSLAHSPPAPRFGAGAGRDCAHSCVHRWSPEGSLQCLQGSALSLEVPTCSWEHEAEQQEKAHDRLRRRPRREKYTFSYLLFEQGTLQFHFALGPSEYLSLALRDFS